MERTTVGNRWADLIRASYEALGRGDARPLLSLLADDVEWRGVPSGLLRRRPASFGKTIACERLRALIEKCDLAGTDSLDVQHVIQRGGRAAVLLSWRTPGGGTIDHAHLLRLGSDRVTEIECYARHSSARNAVEQEPTD